MSREGGGFMADTCLLFFHFCQVVYVLLARVDRMHENP